MVAQRYKSGSDGFTLVEVIAVILILGVLVGVAVINLGSANRSGQVSACQTDFQTVSAALSAYKNDRTETLTNLTLYADDPVAAGDSLVSLGYLPAFPANSTYRIYLMPEAAGISVKAGDPLTAVSPAAYTVNDCTLIP